MNPAFVRNLFVVAIPLFGLAACNDDVVDPPVHDPPTLSPATQWAGGIVRLEWDGLDGDGPTPGLLIGGTPLSSLASGSGFAEYRLPTTAGGTVQIELTGEVTDTFEINVLGFRSASALDVNLDGNLLVWPRGGQASVVGGPGDGVGVVQVLPGAGMWSYLVEDSFPINNTYVRGVGPTHHADLLLLPTRVAVPYGAGWVDVAGLWTIGPGAEAIDTLPAEFSRHAMLLSDSVLVMTYHHEIWSFDPRSGEVLDFGTYEESHGVVISPDGRYGMVRVAGTDGPPVFSGETGEILFHVDSLTRSFGVDFSPGSDTLYMAGMQATGTARQLLMAVDAASGAVLSTIDLVDRKAINISRDLDGPWLFVATGHARASALSQAVDFNAMLVVDARSMEIVGEMAAPACLECYEGSVAVDGTGVYFVVTGEPARVLAFDVWPD